MATQTASSSSFFSSSSSQKYDVFLSFCGVDTRKNFTDHLYTALEKNYIITFRDDEKLERGKYISDELLNAIENSNYAIVILSENYAYSKWCLSELAQIVDRMKNTGLIVFPVFYHVDPSHVRNQTGTFAEAFTEHEKNPEVKIDEVQKWKSALIEVGNTAGWHIHDRFESKVIEEMVGKILGNLTTTNSFCDLVGIKSRMEELVDLLGMGLNDIRFIGICGMGGMGKTTLANVVYHRFRDHFEGSSFLENVREESEKHGLVSLQKQLLLDFLIGRSIDFSNHQINVMLKRFYHKRVLIILDDVDQPNQLEALAGEQSWFGQGSRIIITTRDRNLLRRHKVPEAQIYEVEKLNKDESLKLFSQNAFEKDRPPVSFVELSQKFIYYAKGLPLALKVLGKFLYRLDLILWESTLARYIETPPKEILDVLEISIHGLEERERSIYLDIACFFNGMNIYYVTKILQILYDKPNIDIEVLLRKSLITKSSGSFQMHDLLQELGREIVRRESPQEAGKRSRLWRSEDVLHVLKENTGTKSVKGIFLESRFKKEKNLNAEAFLKMKNLRVLKISNVHLHQGLNYLSSELRSIDWDGYPLESMPTSFEPEKLVELIMHSSLIKQLWKGVKSYDELKLIDLSFSKDLIEIPDLSGVPNLEQLILQGCTTLHRIRESLGNCKRLILLNLSDCKDLDELPKNLGNMKGLEKLDVSRTAIKELPTSIIQLSNLKGLLLCYCTSLQSLPELPLNLEQLILRGCTSLSSLPNCCYSLMSLKILDLSCCSKLDELSEQLGNIKGLEELYLSRTAITWLPLSIENLIGLIKLDLRDCKNLSSLPNGCYSSMSLKILNLSGCSELDELPENLWNIKGLEELYLSGTAITGLPLSIENLIGLIKLDLRDCKNLSSLPNGCYSSMSLKILNLSGCLKLHELPENLGNMRTLEKLDVSGTAITWLPLSVVHLKNLKLLSVAGCVGLFPLTQPRRSPDPLGMIECSLIELNLSYCNLRSVPNVINVIGRFPSLIKLNLRGNHFVCLPESIIQLSTMKYLYMDGCTNLQMLPKLPLNIEFIDVTKCTSLETLSLRPESDFRPEFRLLGCDKFIKNQGYGDLFSTMLRRFIINLQDSPSRRIPGYHLVIPGSEIPKWFSHQNVGASVNLQVPSDLSLGNELMGIAVCAVFVFRQHHQLRQLHIQYNQDFLHTHELTCFISGSTRSVAFHFSEEYGRIESYHLLLHYFPSTYYGAGWKEILNQVDAHGFSQIEVKFEPKGPGLEVTKCGARLVSKRDIEDLINQTNSIIIPYDEAGFEDSEKDTKIKRSNDDSDGEGAGPSNNEPLRLNLIENWFGNLHT